MTVNTNGNRTDLEPNFRIRAQDALSIATLAAYRRLCLDNQLWHNAAEVQKAIDEFVAWQGRNQHRVKLPDHKHVPVDQPVSPV